MKAVQSVKMETANMLLSILFLSDVLAACPHHSALFITAPEKMEALSGSCLQIPCSFRAEPEETFSGTRTTFGVWIISDIDFARYPNNVIFNNSRRVNIYPLNITGDLSEKNCTTLFSSVITSHTDRYYFRVENRPFVSTATCNPLQIIVRDSPPRPRIEISGDLKEKESVTITCSASTPCPHSPPKLTWTLTQDPHNTIEENKDRTLTTKIKTTIILSDQHDGVNISCSASYPVEGGNYKTAKETKPLSVSYSPRNTSVIISPTDPVSVGSVVNLTCSCRGNPPVVNFVWFMMSDGRLEMIKVDTQVYGFKVTDGDRGRLYYCGCRNDVDIQLSTGRQLIFEGDQKSRSVGVEVILKILGIIMLVSTLVIFECWFRSRHSTKAEKDAEEAVYVNSAVELNSQ